MGLKLYEIDQAIENTLEAIYQFAEENDGDIPEDLDELLNKLQFDREKKILDIARYIKTLNAESEAIKNEYIALQKRCKTNKNIAYRLKTYLKMSLYTGEKIKDSNTSLSWRKSDQVNITNEKILPINYFKIERTPYLSIIKSDIKQGIVVDGAELVQKQNLQIK